MNNPEKKENASENQPKLDAILPDPPAVSKGEVLGQFDEYQRKVEDEWEQAKNAYHQKIDQMMEEFLKETLPKSIDTGASSAAPKTPATQPGGPPKTPHIERPAFNSGSDEVTRRLEKLLARAEQGLLHANKRPFFSAQADPEPLALGWSGSAARRWQKGAWAAGSAIMIGAAFWAHQTFFTPPLQAALPYLHAAGPAIKGQRLYVADWFRKMLFVHELGPKLSVVSVENLPNGFLGGLAVTDKHLWTLDGIGGKILQHALTPDHSILREYKAPGKKPVGLCWEQGRLWVADTEDRVLYKLEGTDPEEIVDQFPLPQVTLSAFQVRGQNLWILNGRSCQILLYRLQDKPRQVAEVDLDAYLQGSTPTGIFVDASDVWVVAENPARIQRIPVKKILSTRRP